MDRGALGGWIHWQEDQRSAVTSMCVRLFLRKDDGEAYFEDEDHRRWNNPVFVYLELADVRISWWSLVSPFLDVDMDLEVSGTRGWKVRWERPRSSDQIAGGPGWQAGSQEYADAQNLQPQQEEGRSRTTKRWQRNGNVFTTRIKSAGFCFRSTLAFWRPSSVWWLSANTASSCLTKHGRKVNDPHKNSGHTHKTSQG